MAEAWRRRADEAMTTLARERGKALTGYAYLLTGNLRDAEDLVQDALIKTFVRRRSGLVLDNAEAYVRRAMLTTYIDGVRRARLWVDARHLLARSERAESHEAHVSDRTDVEAALRVLSPQQRTCVVLRYYDDLTVPEIADRLGLSDGTVKRYLSVAVHRLEGLLAAVEAPTVDVDILEGGRP
ncbi:sigma-70 family RNA polymerase sigma factor [Actinotalea fermentans]|uniref:DNA-directed RNA polymerase sigma-70 factor n=1 Tax=Actinotalea fermentans TaxID=43671 RepID=A0A511YY16_9CELL|nr:sigma-70 family RNA polymerase sigma factor [Actinotalea fermentans]KGM15996.1 hypothetical protein N867_04085 [Actinotalea fermentans ATCC 43279 = JCM 9966 = DSM 3133]GEN80092.1 DNA-directed RNA polymerase sigma-70 factor [Actinotalea fermentans]